MFRHTLTCFLIAAGAFFGAAFVGHLLLWISGAPSTLSYTGAVLGALSGFTIIWLFNWQTVAWIVSRKPVADWLIKRSKRTPYYPITSRDGTALYMDRHWLFNAYGKGPNDTTLPGRWERWGLPSIRVHHILRADDDDHMHDHPWNARTIVLRGWYIEDRPVAHEGDALSTLWENKAVVDVRERHWRKRGYTGQVLFNQFHRIAEVPPEGAYTLWFTWKYQGTWGFLVDGAKVPWREYLEGRPRT